MNSFSDGFETALRKAVQSHIETVVTEEIELLKQRIERRVRQETALLAATVVKNVSFEPYSSNQLKIIVDYSNLNTPK